MRVAVAWVLKGCILVSLLLAALASSSAAASFAEDVEGVPIRDDFGRSEVPLATGKFTKANWATAIGGVWNGAYHGYGTDSGGNLSSAFWNQEVFDDFSGTVAVAATVGTGSAPSGQYVALRLDMPKPSGSRSGYEARFSGINGSSSNYKVELAKWALGTRTVLASKAEGFSLPVNTTMVLTQSVSGSVELWTGSGATYTKALSATDSTYAGGYAGIEVLGKSGSYYNFRAGNFDLPSQGDGMDGIWCASASACTAVGTDGGEGKVQAQIRTWNGDEWQASSLPSPPSESTGTMLNDLTCVSSSSCVAVGSYLDKAKVEKTFAMSWNGSSWSNATTPNPSGATLSRLLDISCTSSSSCSAVGTYADGGGMKRTLVLSWNGSSWSLVSSPQPKGAVNGAELEGIDCISTSWCRAVGSYVDSAGVTMTGILGWNGSSWSAITSPNPGGAKSTELNDLDCTTSSWCRAVGSYVDSTGTAKTALLGWNGTSWSVIESPNAGGSLTNVLNSVSCMSSTACIAVGSSELGTRDRPFAIAWNGYTWEQRGFEIEAGPNLSVTLAAVSCTATTACNAVGDIAHNGESRNLAYRYDGGGWSLTDAGDFQRIWKPGGEIPRWGVADDAGASCLTDGNGTYCVQAGSLTAAAGVEMPQVSITNDGSSWTQVAAPLPTGSVSGRLPGVSCASRTFCKAVGSYVDSTGARRTYVLNSGGASSIDTSPNPSGAKSSELTSVECYSSSWCRAVGSYVDSEGVTKTLILAWNGTSWSVQTSPNPSGAKSSELASIDCFNASSCRAAGSYVDSTGVTKTLILAWNGTSWSVQTSPNPSGAKSSELTGVECTKACKAVGKYVDAGGVTKTLALNWSGSAWAVVSTPNPGGATASGLTGVVCTEAARCFATGSYVSGGSTKSLSMLWDGSKWAEFKVGEGPEPAFARLSAVACGIPTSVFYPPECVMVGSGASAQGDQHSLISFISYESEEWWEMQQVEINNEVDGLACVDSEDCLAVGGVRADWLEFGVGWIMDEGEWSPMAMPSGLESWFEDISCSANDRCTAVGRQGNKALAVRWDGTSWTAQTTPTPPGGTSWELYAVSCDSDTHCTAAGRSSNGSQALALEWDGAIWSSFAVPVPASTKWSSLSDVTCNSPESCVAVGVYNLSGTSRPLLERWDGDSWFREPLPIPASAKFAQLNGVSCIGAEECLTTGAYTVESGTEYTYVAKGIDGDWEIESSPNIGTKHNSAREIACYAAERCVSVGSASSSGPSRGISLSWGGASWSLEGTPSPESSVWGDSFDDVACTEEGRCMATGTAAAPAGNFPFTVVSEAEASDASVTDPPETRITSSKPTYTVHDKVPVTVESSEEGSTFQCSYDEEAFEGCPASFVTKQSLAPGWHTLSVRAIDSDHNVDPTPARWVFNPKEYPAAPSATMTSPTDGEKTANSLTLKSAWPQALGDGLGITAVTYQIKKRYPPGFGDSVPWVSIPKSYVRDASGAQVTWPQHVKQSGGMSSPLFFDIAAYYGNSGPKYGTPTIRAVFDGSKDLAGASQPVLIDYDPELGNARDAVESIGPVNVDLITGRATISKVDVSIPVPGTETSLSFGRTYDSTYDSGEGTSVLGGPWQPSIPLSTEWGGADWKKVVIGHEDGEPEREECWTWDEVKEIKEEILDELREEGEEITPALEQEVLEEVLDARCWTEDAIPPADWAEIVNSAGATVEFELEGGKYVTPPYAPELSLRKEEGVFVLNTTSGERFVFSEGEKSTEYDLTSLSNLATANSESRLVYTPMPDEYRLSWIIGPEPAGVTCEEFKGEHYAPSEKGCRSLMFEYEENKEKPESTRLVSIKYYNASGNETSGEVVQRYEYWGDLMIAAWDPRISPALKEQYGYGDSEDKYNLTFLKPAWEEPWEFDYFYYNHDTWDKFKSVSRKSLVSGSPTATTSIRYEVPIEGSGAPYDMSPETIAEWGQSDYPVEATAIFPPTEVPADEPSGYEKATIRYMDPDGYLVNTASPELPGAGGPSITTSETARHGGVVRQLGAQARLEALEAEHPVERSHELDSTSKYSADGMEVLEEWGPLHEVRLESGQTVEARAHSTFKYNEGITPGAEAYKPHLVTTATTGARIEGQSSDVETRVSKTEYAWEWLKPKAEIVDPSGLNLKTTLVYNSRGQTKERWLPGSPSGGTARATKTVYYEAPVLPGEERVIEDSECVSAQWANLPCKTMPVAQPTPAESNPQLPISKVAAYSALDQPTEVKETVGGSVQRTTTQTYDLAGRPVKKKITGTGTSLPATETLYSSTTGRPYKQQLVCEAPESCTGFDNQATTTTFNAIGQPIEYEDADGNKSGVGYDLMGRPVISSDGKGTQVTTYDSTTGVPTQLVDSAAGTFTASYDADGKLVASGLPNGLTAETTYDPTGAPVHKRYQKTSGCSSNCTWFDFDVESSIGGQWLKEANNAEVNEFSYDKAGRLTLVKEKPEGSSCTTRAYAFDADSNRTKLTTRAPGAGGACDTTSAGTVKNYSYDTADRLIGSGVVYDNLGRITSLPETYAGGGTLTSSYYVNDLVRSETQSGLTNTYELDASLRQRKVTLSGTKSGSSVFHYAGGSDSPAWIDEGSGNWTRNIAAFEGLAAIQQSSGTTTLQLTDLHGDVIATASLSSEATGPLSTLKFDEFGNPKQSNGPRFGWLGGKGRRMELPSGVIQMGVRAYVPTLGRFLSPDPVLGGSANAYDYANQNPLTNIDLDGRACRISFHGGSDGAPSPDATQLTTHTISIAIGAQANCSFRSLNGRPYVPRAIRINVKLEGEVDGEPVETHYSSWTCSRRNTPNTCGNSVSATFVFECGSGPFRFWGRAYVQYQLESGRWIRAGRAQNSRRSGGFHVSVGRNGCNPNLG